MLPPVAMALSPQLGRELADARGRLVAKLFKGSKGINISLER